MTSDSSTSITSTSNFIEFPHHVKTRLLSTGQTSEARCSLLTRIRLACNISGNLPHEESIHDCIWTCRILQPIFSISKSEGGDNGQTGRQMNADIDLLRGRTDDKIIWEKPLTCQSPRMPPTTPSPSTSSQIKLSIGGHHEN